MAEVGEPPEPFVEDPCDEGDDDEVVVVPGLEERDEKVLIWDGLDDEETIDVPEVWLEVPVLVVDDGDVEGLELVLVEVEADVEEDLLDEEDEVEVWLVAVDDVEDVTGLELELEDDVSDGVGELELGGAAVEEDESVCGGV